MSYVEDFQLYIDSKEFNGICKLWEEYCANDLVDAKELLDVLEIIKSSEFSQPFGSIVELAIPLWKLIEDNQLKNDVLRSILDLETSNSSPLSEITYKYLHEKYHDHTLFNEKIRLIGLRNKESFQGSIRNYELLSHLEKGNFVFHSGGWGTGEIIEVSLVREQLVLEFENVMGRKDMPFDKAFHYLKPLNADHFLALRFGNPDTLEEKAKANPTEIVRLLLKDLGPKTAVEIKDAMCELVIPEDQWSKWWQSTRSKLKKDTLVECPVGLKIPFRLRNQQLSHEQRFQDAIKGAKTTDNFIHLAYNFLRDFSELLKNEEFKKFIHSKLFEKIEDSSLHDYQRIQLLYMVQEVFPEEAKQYSIRNILLSIEKLKTVLDAIRIVAYKKRLLISIKKHLQDWNTHFISLLFLLPQAPLKDYIFKELNQTSTIALLKSELNNLINNPMRSPQTFVWLFQKLTQSQNIDLPFTDVAAKGLLLESLLVLLSKIDQQIEYKELSKKIYLLISGNRYLVIREILAGKNIHFVHEFLLLVSKCSSLSSHDLSILQSLACVEHPSLSTKQQTNQHPEHNIIWTTQEGFNKLQERIKNIATVETIKNAQEIETAREHGDLKENSEFKYALEKRSQLQAELKMLSDQLNRARIISTEDINIHEIGIGNKIVLKDASGKTLSYTLLGPWDADLDENILSFSSKFAQSIKGNKVGDTVSVQGEDYKVESIKLYTDNL